MVNIRLLSARLVTPTSRTTAVTMASLFEQYEQAAQKAANLSSSSQISRPPLSTSGFINAKFEDDVPIFKKQRTDIRPPDLITHMAVSNSQLVLAIANKTIFRLDMQHPEKPDEVDISEKAFGAKVRHLFLDPSGHHLLISLATKDGDPNIDNSIYLSRMSKKAKVGNKMKGHVVTAVAWNYANMKETTTGPILLGTSKGLLIETELAAGEDWNLFQTNTEQYWKQVFDIGRGGPTTITSLEFYKFPNSDTKHFILATTPRRLYQFIGNASQSSDPPLLQHVFANYVDNPERFLEIPSELDYSQLQFFCNPPRSVPKSFAWMTGAGVFYGVIDCSGQAGQDSVTKDTWLLQYPRDKGEPAKPLSVLVTEFHVLVLFPDKMKAMCILNEQLVFQDAFVETHGRMLGVVKDPLKGTIWAYAERAVFKYKVINEARNVWQVYLEKGEFDLAKQYCKDDPANMDKVLTRQAEDHFNKKNYEESAVFYAITQASFEEITLKFLGMKQTKALKTFLMKKLDGLKQQDKTQLTMIITWIIELFLNELGTMRDSGQKKTIQYTKLQGEFQKFLDTSKVMECITNNKGTVYDLMSSHGDQESLLFFTFLMKDYDRVIQYHIHNGDYKSALEVLQKQKNPELFYQYSPILMQTIPQRMVEAWVAQGRRLDPVSLIPALLQCNRENNQESEAIRYLEFCVQTLDVKSQSIHNYLLSLYVRLNPDKLMTYLTAQGQDSPSVCYDLKYALRLCSEYGLTRACVHIYTTMGLYEEAVDLALQQVDVDLAKQNADRPEEDMELRKKLWLKIAHHVVKEENNIKRAMEFLQECDLIKIEDILPFFPDFVTIDHFKDAICTSLQEYNQNIEVLQEEMSDATKSAQEIRSEIQTFRNRFAFVQGQDKCCVCTYPILTRAFYMFPCQHKFHTDCLVAEVMPHLTTAKRNRVGDIQRQLASQSSREDAANAGKKLPTPVALASIRDQLKTELDDLIASECLYCGEIMIKSIDAPFIEPEEYNEEMKTWE